MSNIGHIGNTSKVSNKVNLSWCIVLAHLCKAEFPICKILGGVQGLMTHAVLGPSLITKPHIISSSGELESRSNIGVVHDPAICRIYYSMLQEHYWCTLLGIFSFNSENIKDIAI